MMAVAENRQLDRESLAALRKRIIANTAKISEYEQIDSFLANFGIRSFIKNSLKEKGVDSFQELLRLRSSLDPVEHRRGNGELLGIVTGAIDALDSFL